MVVATETVTGRQVLGIEPNARAVRPYGASGVACRHRPTRLTRTLMQATLKGDCSALLRRRRGPLQEMEDDQTGNLGGLRVGGQGT